MVLVLMWIFFWKTGASEPWGQLDVRTCPPVIIQEGLATLPLHLGRVPGSPAIAYPAAKTSGLC